MNLTEQDKEEITDMVIDSRDVEEELTVDEMFELLGYQKYETKKKNLFVKEMNKTTSAYIDFQKIFQKIEVYFYDSEEHIEMTKPISIEELKAINKKVEELGWI